jgi:choline dehydrogenase-like flavoprotein
VNHRAPIAYLWSFTLILVFSIDEAVENLGSRSGDDLNSPTALAIGSFTLDAAIDKHGRRISALSAYLSKRVVSKRCDRLTICTGAAASHLELDTRSGLATGVYIRPSSSKRPQKEFFIKARKEIIICSGAIRTPQLLLLSGIGPKSGLEQLDIPLAAELPVGLTLWDHYSIALMLEVPRKETFHILQSIWGLGIFCFGCFLEKVLWALQP